jgi:hypothetical protein
MDKKSTRAAATISSLAASMLLLLGCSSKPNDAKIQRLVVGTWRLDQDPSKTIQNKPDGSYTMQLAGGGSNVLVEGTWQVQSGSIIATMTNAPPWYGPQDPVARRRPETNKVVSIDEHKFVVLSSQDGSTVLTAHKK